MTSFDLSGKIAFVTGATAGFGDATARVLARAGAGVVISGRRTDRLTALADELGDRVHAITLDVRDRDAVAAAVAALPPEFAGIDVLVNNAGLALGVKPAHESDLDDWETMVDTNVKGLMYCTHAVAPGMVARGRGHIVNIGSVAGDYPYPGGNVYGGTKAFVRQFSLNLRADLVARNVRVTNIEPGLSESEFSVVRLKGDTEAAKKVYTGTSPITPADVADTVLWVVTRPSHVNVNRVEMMATCQAAGPFSIHRE